MSYSLRWRFPRRINNLNPQPSEPSCQSKHQLLLQKIQLLIPSILRRICACWFYLQLKLLWQLCGCYYHTDYEISWSLLWFPHQLQDTIRVMFSLSTWRPLYSFDCFSQQKQTTLPHLKWDIWQLTKPYFRIEWKVQREVWFSFLSCLYITLSKAILPCELICTQRVVWCFRL